MLEFVLSTACYETSRLGAGGREVSVLPLLSSGLLAPVRGDLLAAACVFSLDYRLSSGLASGQAHLASKVVICSCQVPRVLGAPGHLACEFLGVVLEAVGGHLSLCP